MPSAASAFINRLAIPESIGRRDAATLAIVIMVNSAALAIMVATEADLVAKVAFLLSWIGLNCFWLAVLRRPGTGAVISLTLVAMLIILSQFKHDKLMMTVNFVDLMIIDRDTATFLLTIMPRLRLYAVLGAVLAVPLLVLIWRLDRFRVRRRYALFGGAFCLGALVALSLAVPSEFYGQFFRDDYVSKFARTGVEAVYELATHGLMESDANVTERLKAPAATCNPAGKLPHIILLHDESSFDITVAPGIKVPPGYQRHFKSFDGAARKLIVEGAGARAGSPNTTCSPGSRRAPTDALPPR